MTTTVKPGKWLSNTYDPSRIDAGSYDFQRNDTNYSNWLRDKLIGPPQATDKYTVEQLQRMNMVGVYTKQEVLQLPDGSEVPLT